MISEAKLNQIVSSLDGKCPKCVGRGYSHGGEERGEYVAKCEVCDGKGTLSAEKAREAILAHERGER